MAEQKEKERSDIRSVPAGSCLTVPCPSLPCLDVPDSALQCLAVPSFGIWFLSHPRTAQARPSRVAHICLLEGSEFS